MDKFDEYKFFVEDTARFSERRQTISNIYVAINTLLLTGIGLLVKDLNIQSYWNLLLPIPLIVAGIAVSFWWHQLIYRYKVLVRLRIKVLRQMEDEIVGSAKMYHREDELYPVDANGNPIQGKGLNLSDIESNIPKLFIILYVMSSIILLSAITAIKFGVVVWPKP